MSSKIARSCDQSCASSGKTLAGEKPKAARTLLYGRGSCLAPRSPGKLCTVLTERLCPVVSASETNRRGPVVIRAAAEAAEERGSLGSTRLQRSVMQLRGCEKGSEALGPHASRWRAPKGPRKSGSRSCRDQSKQHEAAETRARRPGRVRATRPRVSSSRALRASSGQPELQKSVGREVRGRARSPRGCRRLARPEKSRLRGARSTTKGRGPEGDVKSSRSSVSWEQAARRKVNSLNPFLMAAVKVPSGPQLRLLSILACENFFH
ncbi:hypothetical protein B0J15DRAFT_63274 [Fusarium solani]|uniref:Uncharacterized protein n=1 Tax=Fusarium solani TaxID=169388 RepID=A0A9P9KCY2_FUSSL|nr:uncharacterized protein B0J15DRAFT_63274 [Fusarium solani]KAH7248444.1 hypothetical protein B0J15DRAFT_63274 [Fusarium solani]